MLCIIAALTIDTEGFEPLVFNGGMMLLSKAEIPVFFAEYAPHRVQEISPKLTGFDYLKYFFNTGYVVYNNDIVMMNMTSAHAHRWKRETDLVLGT
jgi:hypothetical protein